MHRHFLPLMFVPALLFPLSQAMANDIQTPQAAVEAYIKGVSTGSGKHVKRAFSETARIQFYDDQGAFRNYTRDEFKALVDHGNQWDARIVITEMRITGKAASATVEFTWGENDEHGYVDYLNLLHVGERWHIVSKVAQYVARGE